MSWRDDLRPASWRGLPFETWHQDGQFGRRIAVHEYPFRDDAWVEDLGRGVRRLTIIGYLEGEDVQDQAERMIAAAERRGPGELVHPTLGLLQVTLANLSVTTRHDLGRVAELSFQFLEAGERAAPDMGFATGWGVMDAANAADAAAAGDFATRARAALQQGSAAAQQAQRTVRLWTSTAQRLSGTARNLVSAVGGMLPGRAGRQFSRFANGSRSPLAGLDRATSSVSQRLGRANRGRLAVGQAAADISDLAGRL